MSAVGPRNLHFRQLVSTGRMGERGRAGKHSNCTSVVVDSEALQCMRLEMVVVVVDDDGVGTREGGANVFTA